MTLMWTLLKAISLSILISSAYAQKAGDVIKQKGTTNVEREEKTFEKIPEGFEINSQDLVRAKAGVTAIEFLDETRVDLTEGTKLKISKYVYDPDKKTGALTLDAAFGTVRYASGQIAKRSRRNVAIKTPTATVGVRGTDFAMTIDEFGGSIITLLPSCNTNGDCLVGEISVTSDVGTVILNQAFQATTVPTRMDRPTNPIKLDLLEFDIMNMLLRRRPIELDEALESRRVEELSDFLGIDYLKFSGLDKNALELNEKETWWTELDIDFLENVFLVDVLEVLNKQLAKQMKSSFEKKDKPFLGKDPETGLELYDDQTKWIFRRDDGSHITELNLNKSNGYNINLKQDAVEFYDLQVGEGRNNEIDIIQVQ